MYLMLGIISFSIALHSCKKVEDKIDNFKEPSEKEWTIKDNTFTQDTCFVYDSNGDTTVTLIKAENQDKKSTILINLGKTRPTTDRTYKVILNEAKFGQVGYKDTLKGDEAKILFFDGDYVALAKGGATLSVKVVNGKLSLTLNKSKAFYGLLSDIDKDPDLSKYQLVNIAFKLEEN